MSRQIEFYYDYGSPAAYLAWTQMPALAVRAGAELVRRPILLGGVFKATGNRSPMSIAAKGAWMTRDLARFAERYGVPFAINSNFIVNTLAIMRGALVAANGGVLERYDDAMFHAMWVAGRDMSDPAAIAAVLSAAGLDVETYRAGIQDDAIKQALIAATTDAVDRGVFGTPSFFVDDELFFGQDRLDFVEAALGD